MFLIIFEKKKKEFQVGDTEWVRSFGHLHSMKFDFVLNENFPLASYMHIHKERKEEEEM